MEGVGELGRVRWNEKRGVKEDEEDGSELGKEVSKEERKVGCKE